MLVWLQNLNYSRLSALGLSVTVWLILPFVISQVCAAFGLRGMRQHVRSAKGPAEKIAEAVKGLPPKQHEAVDKRIIDESLK